MIDYDVGHPVETQTISAWQKNLQKYLIFTPSDYPTLFS